jgi:hypothetical protein
MKLLVAALIISISSTAFADDINVEKSLGEVNKPLWFSEFGLSTNSGATFQEKAQGWGFLPGWALGPDVMVGLLTYRFNRVFLTLGYLYYGTGLKEGTELIEVSTSYQRMNFTLNYDFIYKILIVGAHVGGSLMIVRTDAVLRDFDVTISGGSEVEYENQTVVDEVKAIGAHMGFLGGLSVGLDLDPLFRKYEDKRKWLNFEFRLIGDYVRYGERDGFFAGAGIAYWPFSR